MDLLEKKKADKAELETDEEQAKSSAMMKPIEKLRLGLYNYFVQYVYSLDPTFRFTSRYCNTITVALVSLFYVCIYWTYAITILVAFWPKLDAFYTNRKLIIISRIYCYL